MTPRDIAEAVEQSGDFNSLMLSPKEVKEGKFQKVQWLANQYKPERFQLTITQCLAVADHALKLVPDGYAVSATMTSQSSTVVLMQYDCAQWVEVSRSQALLAAHGIIAALIRAGIKGQ
jgi:hypothetical protein